MATYHFNQFTTKDPKNKFDKDVIDADFTIVEDQSVINCSDLSDIGFDPMKAPVLVDILLE